MSVHLSAGRGPSAALRSAAINGSRGTEVKTAAFFRVEGTIISRGVLAATSYIAANGQGFAERAMRVGGVALAAPFYSVLGQTDRTMANRMAYLAFRNMREDRVAVIGREYYDEVLKEKTLDSGIELLKQAKRDGHTTVLLSEGLDHVVGPLAKSLGRAVDHFVCNRLEYRDQFCTGRLIEPVIGGHETRKWIQAFADENDIDLSKSIAYAAHGPDLLLLAAVGSPCAVNPDYALRRAATEADWPVVEYRV